MREVLFSDRIAVKAAALRSQVISTCRRKKDLHNLWYCGQRRIMANQRFQGDFFVNDSALSSQCCCEGGAMKVRLRSKFRAVRSAMVQQRSRIDSLASI